MSIDVPNFLSVRLTPDDKRQYETVQAHFAKLVGRAIPAADMYRVAMQALIEKHNMGEQ